MSSTLAQAASRGPHLELESRVPIRGDGQFVMRGEFAYLSQRYGNANHITVVDVSDPAAAKLVREVEFKRAITSVALAGETLLAAESNRALNFLDLSDPANPAYFECGLALGVSLHDVAVMGDYAVLALNWDGVGLMPLDDPSRAEFSDRRKLDTGYVDYLLVLGELIFTPGGSGGLHVFRNDAGTLVEVASHVGEKVRVSNVFEIDGKVWALADVDGKSHIWVIDPAVPGEIETSFRYKCAEPRAMKGLGDGRAVGWSSNYTCLGFDAVNEWSGEVFKQYTADSDGSYREVPCDVSEMDDDTQQSYWSEPLTCMDGIRHAVRRDDWFYVTQGAEFQVFRLTPDSLFRGLSG